MGCGGLGARLDTVRRAAGRCTSSARRLPLERASEAEAQRQQPPKSWALRAAMSLARLARHQGNVQQARELLAPVYGRFTEGFDTRDLKEAKALLRDLT